MMPKSRAMDLIELYKLAAVLDELTRDSRAAGREVRAGRSGPGD
jgi:hypothetical protein